MAKIEIGITQKLTVVRTAEFGVYLGLPGEDPEEAVLLPKKQVPESAHIGSEITVFVYRDSEDRIIATTNIPLVKRGQFGYLKVKGVTKVGAFLDWGLEKDLFMPFKEQEEPVRAGDKVMVYVYLDKSGRLCASGKLYARLKSAGYREFKDNDDFTGVVYRTEKEHGVFVAVFPKKEAAQAGEFALDELYFGLIPPTEAFRKYRVGELVTGRVMRVRKDRKLDVSERGKIPEMLDKDGDAILKKIDEYGGALPFSEGASPEIIKRELSMSKNAFKRALGHLLKAGKIEIKEEEVIRK